MTAKELVEWMAYFTLEPWGQVQADYRAGVIASTMVNTMADTKGKAFGAKDFFDLYDRGKKQTPAEQMALLRGFAKADGEVSER